MKKVVSVLLVALLLCSFGTLFASADGYLETAGTALPDVEDGWTRYEAEDAEIWGSNKAESNVPNQPEGTEYQSFFSGELAAGGFGNNAQGEVYTMNKISDDWQNIAHVKFTINAASDGYTLLTIAFNGADPDAGFCVQSGEDKETRQLVACPAAPDTSWNRMGTVTCEIPVVAGENTVYISRSLYTRASLEEAPWRNIDFIDVKDEVTAEPQLTGTETTTTTAAPTTTTTAANTTADNATTTTAPADDAEDSGMPTWAIVLIVVAVIVVIVIVVVLVVKNNKKKGGNA